MNEEQDGGCPMCDCEDALISHTPKLITFSYAAPEWADLQANVVVHECLRCGEGWLDYIAEEAQDAAINVYKEARAKWLNPGEPLSTPLPHMVWVASKQRFYSCGHPEFRLAFQALCEWSTADLGGPAWVTPVLHEGRWHACARTTLGVEENITVKAHSPFAVTVALAVTLDLLETN